jgi:hypothetical protein
MVDTRNCEQCGIVFEPRREHARFCSARCRVAWNRDSSAAGGSGGSSPLVDTYRRVETSALDWSIIAMREATDRLRRVSAGSGSQAYAVISEAVWWVTIVDGTLMRYRPDACDRALAGVPTAERRRIEGTFSGLRFVRNWMGYHADHADFIQPQRPRLGSETGRITAWTWKSLPEPTLAWLPPRSRSWEMTRYRAYQAEVAGRTVGDVFAAAAGFLRLATAAAVGTPATSAPATSAPATSSLARRRGAAGHPVSTG